MCTGYSTTHGGIHGFLAAVRGRLFCLLLTILSTERDRELSVGLSSFPLTPFRSERDFNSAEMAPMSKEGSFEEVTIPLEKTVLK